MPSKEDELERLRLANSPRLLAILNAAKKRLDRGEGVPHEQFWAKIEAKNRKATKRRPRSNERR